TQTVVDEAELLAAQAAAEAAAAQQQQPGGAFNNVGQGLTGKFRDMMMQYWQETINLIEHDDHDFKNHQLPLARIKKVMKTDEDVRMISAEAPILFAKGCDVFITELTMRAWIHAEENKRRTLQKSDIAAALTKSDMFDFLIDVVPREEEKPKKFAGNRTYMSQPQPSIPHQAHLQQPHQSS
ncbi:histone-fold-containing protein, partial [Suhomyces tanzawaensis NRRL Y-17324]